MKRPRKLVTMTVASLTMVTPVMAHVVSIGYENAGPGSVTFWYGSYHSQSEASYTEGSLHLTDGGSFDQTVAFDTLAYTKPSGLVDGTTNFFTDDGSPPSLTDTNNIDPVESWQGVTFTGLSAGTYTFTYIPIDSPTQVWEPWDDAVLSNSVVLDAAILGLSIDDLKPGMNEIAGFFTMIPEFSLMNEANRNGAPSSGQSAWMYGSAQGKLFSGSDDPGASGEFYAGMAWTPGQNVRLGVGPMYAISHAWLPNGSIGDYQAYGAGGFLSWQPKHDPATHVDVESYLTAVNGDFTRNYTVSGTDSSSTGSTNGWSFKTAFEVSRDYQKGDVTLSPYAGYEFRLGHTDPYQEVGGDHPATVSALNDYRHVVRAGVQASRLLANGINVWGRAGVWHRLGSGDLAMTVDWDGVDPYSASIGLGGSNTRLELSGGFDRSVGDGYMMRVMGGYTLGQTGSQAIYARLSLTGSKT